MFSHHNGIKLEINNRKITEKSPKRLKIQQLLNNSWIKEKGPEKFFLNTLNGMKMKIQHTYQIFGITAKAVPGQKFIPLNTYI